MKKKSDILFYSVLLSLVTVIFVLELLPQNLKLGNPVIRREGERYPTIVSKVPEGFVSLVDIEDEYGDIIQYSTFEGALFYIDDLDGVEIDSSVYDDETFVVKYEGELYVSQEVADKILDWAPEIARQRQRIYKVGEEIPFQSVFRQYFNLTLNSAEEKDTVEEFEISDGNRALVIEFSADIRRITDYRDSLKTAADYFGSVETVSGAVYSDFSALSDTSVVIQIPKEESVKYIHMASPFWPSSTRTAVLE